MRDNELAGLAMVLGKDCKMKVTITGESSYINQKANHINIARMPTTPLGRMLMTGLVFHEIGHKNYTTKDKPSGLKGDMTNCIEDIRTEIETIKMRPGTRFNLEAITKHYVGKGDLAPQNINHALIGKCMGYGRARVLKQGKAEELEKASDEMLEDAFSESFVKKVELVLADIVNLKDTQDSIDMADKVIHLLIQEKEQKKKQQQKQQQAGGQPGDGSGNGQGDGKGKGQGKEKGGQQGAGGFKGGQWEPSDVDKLINEQTGFGDIAQLIQQEMDDLAINNKDKANTVMLPDIGQQPAYSKLNEVHAISASSRMRARMIGFLESTKRKPKQYGLSGKKIAASKLVKMSFGDPKIFRKKSEEAAVNTAVVIMVDASGSMGGEKQAICSEASFALHNTLYGLPGVSACTAIFAGTGGRKEVSMLTNFDEKPTSQMFNQPSNGGTPMAAALWAARALLLNRPEPRKILLVLTDGEPDSRERAKTTSERLESEGIEIGAIGIIHEGVKHIWPNHKIINNIKELPPAVFGVMQEMLTKRRMVR